MSGETIDPIESKDRIHPLPSVTGGNEIHPVANKASLSSIEPMQKREKEHTLDPSVPGLPLPFQFSFVPLPDSKEKIAQMYNEITSNAVNKIVENWSKNIQYEAEAQKREWQERIRKGFDRTHEIMISSGAKEGESTVPAIISAVLILAPAAGTLATIGATSTSSIPGQILIHDVSNVVVGMEIIVPDMRDMLGYLGALISASLFVQSVRTNLAEVGIGPSAKEFDLKFVKKYAAQIIGLITNPNFGQIINFFLPPEKLEKIQTMKESEQLKFFSMLKVQFLMMAIAFISKVELGHIIGLDLKGMVDGITQLPKEDPRLPLIEQFKRAIGSLSPNEQAVLKELLYAYFDKGVKEEDVVLPGQMLHAAAAFGGGFRNPF